MIMPIALVTGGARGLGFATARRLAKEGFRVIVADLDATACEEAAAALDGGDHAGRAVDMADEQSVWSLFDETERRAGPIAGFLNFAGILGTQSRGRVSLSEMGVEEWDRVLQVNARGSFLGMREMARRRSERPVDNGRVILLASLAGQVGGLQSGAAYSASKGAVLALAKTGARELAPLGITVNVIAPGPIDTAMLRATAVIEKEGIAYGSLDTVPLGRIGQPDEIAAAAAYLMSPLAGFVTGATIDVNGGMLMR